MVKKINDKYPQVISGCMRFSDFDRDGMNRYIHSAMELGINFFDHADIYGGGKSEEIFGLAMKDDGSLKREDMIAATSHVECDFDLTAIGYGPGVKADGQRYIYKADETLLSYALQSDGIIAAPTGTGDIFLTDKVKKDYYRECFGIEAFDMETAAIASVCDKAEIPFLSLRKISDDADDSSVEDYREMNNRKESCLTELLLNILGRMLKNM